MCVVLFLKSLLDNDLHKQAASFMMTEMLILEHVTLKLNIMKLVTNVYLMNDNINVIIKLEIMCFLILWIIFNILLFNIP